MRLLELQIWLWIPCMVVAQSTQGIIDLVARRMPNHLDAFEFELTKNENLPIGSSSELVNDDYLVSSTTEGKIHVEGNSLSALASGLHRYLADVAHVDIWWFIGSQLNITLTLPVPTTPLKGSSIVPWRYHLNTVTFSYTSAFWNWNDWELELDWMALHGVNLALAWVGFEKTLLDVYREIEMTDSEILSYFSGPAFQAWNRFGNIQRSWGGELPMEWINDQFELQKKITKRMVDLGMTPVLPCFTGFVPSAIARILPNATVVNGSNWDNAWPTKYSNVTFLEPNDPNFAILQKSFISKQAAAYGNITHIYTLDQFNENDPYSGDLETLQNISANTWQSLKSSDPEAIWMMQGWLFYEQSSFWTDDRIEAYLGGVDKASDMIIIDLYSESAPQWQRTNSYFGKPWLWCQLHAFGGNMGLYGQIENITINPIEALATSSSLVGFGHTMEDQKGNEIIYDLLLDQAWSASPIDTKVYFANWASRRYSGNGEIPQEIYSAWDILGSTVFNSTNSTFITAPKSILELSPDISGLLTNPFTILSYNPADLVSACNLLFNASKTNPDLWNNQGYAYDITDVTRQVLANNFTDIYASLISAYSTANVTNSTLSDIGNKLISILTTIDALLESSLPAFSLSTWLDSAHAATTNATLQAFYDYDARNLITLWGPDGEINDYASKQWGGLVGGYDKPRWGIFISYLMETPIAGYNVTKLNARLRIFEEAWQVADADVAVVISTSAEVGALKDIIAAVVGSW